MKKNNIKKVVLSIVLTIVIVLSIIAVGVLKKENTDTLKESESKVVENSQNEIVNATEKKEQKTTAKATTEKQTEVEKKETEATTNYVAPVTTTKKQESVTNSVVTTKAPKTTTTKPAKPTTTKANKDEYYPALTASDMEYLKQYAADYIKSKGYTHNPDLDWDNCGYSSAVGMNDNLANYGNKYKINGGISPVEWAKQDIKSRIDGTIDEFGDVEWLEMTLLVERNEKSWGWAIGYMA